MRDAHGGARWACFALLAAAYFLAGKVGLSFAFVHASASAVWPPTGIALAALLLLGYGAWPAIFAGAFWVNWSTAGSVATSLGIATGNTLEAALGALLVNRYAGGKDALERPATLLRFVGLAAFVSTMSSPTIGVASLALGGYAAWDAFLPVWTTWWLGDAVGNLVVAPLLLLWAGNPRLALTRRRIAEAAVLLWAVVVAGLVVFGGWLAPIARGYPIDFLCVPLLIWAAFRFSQREVMTVMLILSAVAVWGTLAGRGPFARRSQHESLLLLQSFVGVMSILAMTVSALVTERRRSERALSAARDELETHVRDRTRELSLANETLRAEVEERKRAVAALRESEAVLSQAQDLARIGGWRLDFATGALRWSDSLHALLGCEVGRVEPTYASFLERVHPEDRDAVRRALDPATQVGQPFLLDHRIQRPDGSVRFILEHVQAVADPGGRMTGLVGTAQDVTEMKLAQESLLYSGLSQSIPIGLCVLYLAEPEDDRSLRLMAANPAALKMTGLPLERVRWKPIDEIAPGLRALGIPAAFAEVARTGVATEVNEMYYGDERLPKGYWAFKAFPLPDRCVGVAFENITERKETARALKEANEALVAKTRELSRQAREATLLNELSSVLRAILTPVEAYAVITEFGQMLLPEVGGMLYVRDESKDRLVCVSRWGEPPSSMPEFHADDCWGFRRGRPHQVEDPHSGIACAHIARPLPAGWICAPLVAWGKTLGILHVQDRVRPLAAPQLRIAQSMVEQLSMALANLRLQEKLRRQADCDALTGLFNRRYLDRTLPREVDRAARKATDLCVIMLDLDRFKSVNDTFGHPAGDELLRQLGELLRERTRDRDVLCRYGGEEFTLVFPDTSIEESLRRVRELQDAVREVRIHHEGEMIGGLSVSAGVSAFPLHGETGEDLIRAADAALYEAKREGGGSAVIARKDWKAQATREVPRTRGLET